jgi:hypothetical protein
MRVSTFLWAAALSFGLALMPTFLIAQPAPSNTVEKNLDGKRHTNYTSCRYTGQRCSTGCGTFPDKGVCAEYVCDRRSWNFSGFCLKAVCSRKSC